MISFGRLSTLAFVSALFVSCSPFPPDSPFGENTAYIPYAEKVETTQYSDATTSHTEIAKQKEANRRRLAAKKKLDAGAWQENQAENKVNTETEITKKSAPPTKPKSKYPTAQRTREGFVKNPYTGAEVDVRGMPGGSLVYDPDDPNYATNRFRIP